MFTGCTALDRRRANYARNMCHWWNVHDMSVAHTLAYRLLSHTALALEDLVGHVQ